MKTLGLKVCLILVTTLFTIVHAVATDTTRISGSKLRSNADNGGLKLQAGFGAVTVVDSLARNRHLVVSSNGDIYVKLARLQDGKGILVLREKADGKAEVVKSFANYPG